MLTALKPTKETIDLVAGLKGRWHGSYAMCRCPAHADEKASLSIRQGNRGLLVHCFAAFFAIRLHEPPPTGRRCSRACAAMRWRASG